MVNIRGLSHTSFHRLVECSGIHSLRFSYGAGLQVYLDTVRILVAAMYTFIFK